MKQLYILLFAFVGVAKCYSQSIVKPLVHTVWNQDYPYNSSCPKNIFGNQAVTGCAPTAMAQVMNCWNYPLQGKGSNLYEPFGYLPQYVDFSNATYNWPLPEFLTSINNDISKLMYHCGVSMSVQYGTSETFVGGTLSGNFSSVMTALENYFGYNSSSMQVVKKLGNDADWITLLKNELNAGHPIIYSGNGSSGGHVWICDGYNNNNEFHMNFGWKFPESNIFYSIKSLNNVSVISSNKIINSYDFSNNQEAIIGIQPNYNTPDLVINDQSATNYNPVAGNTITAYCTEKNYGSVASGTTNVSAVLLPVSNPDYFSVPANIRKENVLKTVLVSGLASYMKSGILSIPATIPPSTPTGTYYLYLVADVNNDVTEQYELNNAVPIVLNITAATGTCYIPSNDNCGNSTLVTVNGSSINGTTCGANGDNTFASYPGVKDVFYYIQPYTSNITITVTPSAGSSFYPSLQLLSGGCYNLTPVNATAITSSAAGQSASKTFQVISGNTYYIRVWDNGMSNGNFNISVTGTSCITPGKATNLSPGTSSAPGQTITNTQPQLSWNAPAGATSYIVYISKGPVYGSDNLVNPSGFKTTSPYLQVPAGYLLNGYNYRWNVFAYPSDGASCYSVSDVAYFSINTGTTCSEPATQSSNIIVTGKSSNNVTVNWTVGSGERHIVKINTTNSFNNITNGTTPATANTNYQGGEQVVYDGTSNYVIVYGLSPSTTYYFKVYDANCSGTMSMYNNNTDTNNPNSVTTASATTTCTEPTVTASNVTFSSVGTNSMTVNWTSGNGSKRIVKINTYDGFTAPIDGTDPSYNNNWNNVGEQIIYNGSGNSITVTNLNPNTQYCFKVFEANCSGSNIVYSKIYQGIGGCISTLSTNPPLSVPFPNYGSIACNATYLYTLDKSSSYALSWGSNNLGTNVYYDVEIREYPYSQSSPSYSQNCISGNTVYIPGSVLEEGKLYAWKVRANTNCGSNVSDWSQTAFFGIRPSVSPNGSITVCNGQGIMLTTPVLNVPSPGTVTYQWYKTGFNGESDTLVGIGNSYYASTKQYYFVKLKYSGSTICSDVVTSKSAESDVYIYTTPEPPVLSSNSPVCEGTDLKLSATGVIGNLMWIDQNGNLIGTNWNSSPTFKTVNKNAEGTYTAYNFNACPSALATVSVTINPAPIASFSSTINGKVVSFTNTSTYGDSFDWNFGDGQSSTDANPIHTYTIDGNYTVCLTVNKNGCNPSNFCQPITIGTVQNSQTLATFEKVFRYLSNTDTLYVDVRSFVQSEIDSSYICVSSYTGSTKSGVIFYKMGKDGYVVWARELPEGNFSQYYPSIIRSKNGYLMSFYGGSNASYAPIIMEIDEQGNKLWLKKYSNTSGGFITSFVQTTDGYIARASSRIIKIDNSGNTLWVKQFIPSSTNYYYLSAIDRGKDFIQDVNGNLYFASSTSDKISNINVSMITKLDPNGNLLWTKSFTPSMIITSMLLDKNGDIVCTYSVSTNNGYIPYILKLNSSGNIIIAKKLTTNYTGIRLININYDNSYNCSLNGTQNAIININSSLSVQNKGKGIFSSVYTKGSLDNKIAITYPYTYTSSSVTRWGGVLAKISFDNISCLDLSLNSIVYEDVSLITQDFGITQSTLSETTSDLNISTNIIALKDSDICHTCNLTATITPSGATTFCQGGGVSLSANAGMSSYLWSNGSTTPSIMVTASGSYYVTITDAYGCSATSDPVTVTVNPVPDAPASILGSSSVCSGTAQLYYVKAVAGATSYTWTLPDGWTSNPNGISNIPVVGNSGGVISVTANNACGSGEPATLNVSVIPSVTPSVTISPSPSITACSGHSVTFTATPVNGGTSPVYEWFFNGISVGNNSAVYTKLSIASNAEVYCKMTSNQACRNQVTVNSPVTTVIVSPIKTPTIQIQQTSCDGNTVTFSSTINNGGSNPSYLWKVLGGAGSTAVSGYTSPTFTLSNAFNDIGVTCTLTSSELCVDNPMALSNTININCIATAVNNIDGLEAFELIPNPNHGEFAVKMKLNTLKDVSFRLCSVTGNVIYKTVVYHLAGEQTTLIKAKDIPAGVYLLITTIGKKEIVSKVVVVR